MLANSVDTDQMPHYVASDLGLHCLPMTLLQDPGLQWVNHMDAFIIIAGFLTSTVFSNIRKTTKMVFFLTVFSKLKILENSYNDESILIMCLPCIGKVNLYI